MPLRRQRNENKVRSCFSEATNTSVPETDVEIAAKSAASQAFGRAAAVAWCDSPFACPRTFFPNAFWMVLLAIRTELEQPHEHSFRGHGRFRGPIKKHQSQSAPPAVARFWVSTGRIELCAWRSFVPAANGEHKMRPRTETRATRSHQTSGYPHFGVRANDGHRWRNIVKRKATSLPFFELKAFTKCCVWLCLLCL